MSSSKSLGRKQATPRERADDDDLSSGPDFDAVKVGLGSCHSTIIHVMGKKAEVRRKEEQ